MSTAHTEQDHPTDPREGAAPSHIRSTRLRATAATGCVCIAFVTVAVAASQLEIGSVSHPGPGFWPLVCALIGIGCSLLTITADAFGASREAPGDALTDEKSPIHWPRAVIFGVLSVGFLVAYPYVGFLASAIPFVFLLLWIVSRVRLVVSIPTAIVTAVVLYLVFAELLNVRI